MSVATKSPQRPTRVPAPDKPQLFQGVLSALPALLVVGILAAGLLTLGWRSFHEYDAYTGTQGMASLVQFQSLLAGDNSRYYVEIIVRTLVVSIVVMFGSVLLALPVSYFIVRTQSNIARSVVLGLSLVPFLMGDVVRSFGWLLLLGTNGAYGWMTSFTGPRESLVGSSVGVTLGILHTMVPISIFILLPAVRRIEPDMEHAAATLGARPVTVWIRIVLPLLRPGIVSAGVVAFALATTQYAIPDMLGGGRFPFAANAIQTAFFAQGNINLGSALAVIMLIIVFSVVAISSTFGKTRVRHPDMRRQIVLEDGYK